MRTATADGRRAPRRPGTPARSALAPVLVAALALGTLGACSDETDDGPTEVSLEETASSIQAVLRRRARAVLDGNEERFARTVARPLRSVQRTIFENYQDLPVATLRHTVVPATVVRADGGRGYWVEVATTLRLEGYDATPVTTYDRWQFTLGEHGRRLALSSTNDPAWEAEHGAGVQPWEVGRVAVRERYDVLGIFDATTVDDAEAVLDSVGEGQFDVGTELPEPRDDGAADLGTVVYVLSDPAVVDALSGRAVGDPERADGLTIAIPSDTAEPAGPVASYRVSLDPAALGEDRLALDRLVRHELTHVQLGDRGRGGPLWITEGVAEYVSVQRLDPAERRLPASALEIGAVATTLPTAEDFAGPDAEAWYAVSWWVCEYVARTFGDSLLWVLLDELADGADVDAVLADRLGLTGEELVRRGAALMASTYR